MSFSKSNLPEYTGNCKDCSHRINSFFCKAKSDALDKLDKERTTSHYKKGETIFKEGQRPFGIFCLFNGKIKLSKIGDDGKEHIIRLIKPGDLFGYRSILGADKYHASAVAIDEATVCFIPKEQFIELLDGDKNLTFEMIKILSEDLKNAELQMTHMARKPVRERAAEAVLFIKETYGYEEDGQTINAIFSREDIANIVGTATETIIRLLSEFNREGIIQLQGKKIKIIDEKKLIFVANIFD